jgi:inosine-uridine nucleoside N-ribohydrolase
MPAARIRLISDNDYGGDPDGLFQLAHHLLSPSVDLRLVIGSHLRENDPFDSSDRTADHAADRATEVAEALGRTDVRIVAGSNHGLPGAATPVRSDAALGIVEEAMRHDSEVPLYVACGAGLTEIASAWLIEPRIAERLVLVWIGGGEYPSVATPPPGAMPVEYNLLIDVPAAQVVFNDSDLTLWQVPRDAYRQTLVSLPELRRRVRPHGAIGRLLHDSIETVRAMLEDQGVHPGETYALGDSPLVLLTALQSPFEPDPSSSVWTTLPRPRVAADGSLDFAAGGREARVFTRLDVRLMFEDLVAKLEEAAGAR